MISCFRLFGPLKRHEFTYSCYLQNGYVLCRVYQKSGPGPRNGFCVSGLGEISKSSVSIVPVKEDDDDNDGLEREELNHPIEYGDGIFGKVSDNRHGNEILSQRESIMEMKPLVNYDHPDEEVMQVHVVFHYSRD